MWHNESGAEAAGNEPRRLTCTTDPEATGGDEAVAHPTEPLTPTQRLMLIRSIAGNCDTHEERAFDLIRRILDGAEFDELVDHSVARYGF